LNIDILKSKIHRAKVTDANIYYMGSITIDRELMDHANLVAYEKVLVVSLDSGQRLETYVIEGKKGSREICLNGAAARKIIKGDRIIVMSFASIDCQKAGDFKPKVVTLDEENRIIDEEYHVDDHDQC